MAQRMNLDRVDECEDVLGVDPGRLEHLLANGAAKVRYVSVEPEAAFAEKHIASEGVAI